jgi:uncharacterized protein
MISDGHAGFGQQNGSMIMRIEVARDRIADFCRRWQIIELSLFGSALRDDFRPDSDVDVLVVFAPGSAWGFRELLQMEEELAGIFGRNVDLVEKRLVEQNRNYIIRRHILRSAEPVYVA